ncbi:RND family efflux transporter MFP subunit [Rhodothalassium salexigens DSM 2132]|uniref:RND family efflux transporter MFP subunit n=2 Tax=Rhodothalassium salexigens TaxID=1086 RepID=A0A4R2PIR2_RHOSA|nr:hypothetical protein [Rhodothalassium salexigens DSM 2132]TCP34488.1 RND family efflux transporter MFP subunit [Rhodothalassium salexigens DSM 2132]
MTDNRAALLHSLRVDRTERPDVGPRPRRPVVTGLMLLLAFVAGGAAVLLFRPAPDPSAVATPGPPASTTPSTTSSPVRPEPAASAPAPAAVQTAPSSLIASGYVVARRRATVSPQVSGQLLALFVEEGAEVAKGQRLAQLDAELAEHDLALNRARLKAAEAAVQRIRADLAEADLTLSRTRDLQTNDFSSRAALDQATARVGSLRAQLAGAEAEVAAAQATAERQQAFVERFTVRAPFDGVVIDKNAQPGEFVAPASAGGEFTRTGVYTLVDMASLEIEVDVNEGQIGRVGAGQRTEIVLDAYRDWTIPGHVLAIIPTADRDRATIQVRVGFDNRDGRVLPEMAAKVAFIDREDS